MAIRINGDNTTAAPGITNGTDTDTGIQFGTDEVKIVTTGGTASTNPHTVLELHNNNTGDFGAGIAFTSNRNGNETTATIGLNQAASGATNLYHNCTQGHFFQVNGSNKCRIDTDGLKFNNDTAAANALDDYEIGTWTPTMNSSVSSPAVTYTDREGKYVKVGDIVTCFFDVTATSISGGSGDPRITGLPFNVPNTHAGYSAIQWRSSNAFSAGSAGTILRGYAEQGAAYIVPQLDHTGTNGYGFAGNPTWGSLGRITGYITYQTGT